METIDPIIDPKPAPIIPPSEYEWDEEDYE